MLVVSCPTIYMSLSFLSEWHMTCVRAGGCYVEVKTEPNTDDFSAYRQLAAGLSACCTSVSFLAAFIICLCLYVSK